MADSGQELSPPLPARSRNPLRRLYHWILSWANHPWGTVALAVFSFLDSFVFPIPPLFLQVALSLERPKRSFWYAFVDTTASVAGAVAGYWIGYALWDSVGVRIVGELSPEKRQMLQQNQFVVTIVYSFVPMPFKFITLGSGFLHLSIATLLVASTLGRSARFFALAALCFVYGPRAKGFIEKHFNGVCLGVGVLIAVVLVLLKVVLKR
ncbi:MAG TPA: VTT domain-containing protein [Planctomycetota bacterium]|nr:VTT domain-containing protein [Planctomycetota bacterium]